MEHIILNNGLEMPILGYGVFQITDQELCEQCVVDAIEAGYRLIDTAASYQNEEAVGRAIKRSGVKREDLFITTKLWLTDTGYEQTLEAFNKSLERLQLDYLDMYLIHQPYGDVHGSWRAMEELYAQGKIKAIGVSNFDELKMMDFVLTTNTVPAVNQIEVHPFLQQTDRKVMEEFNIQMQAWAPLAEIKDNILENETLVSIAKKYDKSTAQVILRWHTQRGIVVIPKSQNKHRIIENIDIFDFELTNEDMAAIKTLDENRSLFPYLKDPETVRMLFNR